MKADNTYCQRCGNCCKGMVWKKRFSFKEVFSTTDNPARKEDIEASLVAKHRKRLKGFGLPPKETKKIEWNNEKKMITVYISVGRCVHLAFSEDGKAVCMNYENRPDECRGYLCKKAREKAIIDKMKESEISAKAARSLMWSHARPGEEVHCHG